MKIDLENRNVYTVDMSVSETRHLVEELLDDDSFDDLSAALDQAQGDVHMGSHDVTYVVIKIA